MSQVAISGNASGTGTLTIAAPNTNSNYTLTLPTNTGTIVTNKTAGTVLQVVNAVKSDTFSSASGSFVDITGMSVTITPTSASSKIFVDVVMTCGAPAVTPRFLVLRGSTSIGIGDSNGSRQRASFGTGWSGDVNQMTNMSWKFLDSPATTSATTYKVQGAVDGSTFFINRASNYPDNATLGISVISTITVWEIAA